jgi:hypothetical protein
MKTLEFADLKEINQQRYSTADFVLSEFVDRHLSPET